MMAPVFLAKMLTLFFAAEGDPCTLPKTFFFFMPNWWEYLNGQRDPLGACVPAFNFPNDIWTVGLAILDMLLRLAGFVAVISIIIAGIMYITATGEPEKAANARRRLYNSLIGLGIALIATGFVAFIGNKVGG